MLILAFRICLLISFLVAVYKLADWKNWQKYYPTILFVMVLNLFASFITYHHALWCYNPDFLVKTETVVELANSFIMLPATAFIFLSKFPDSRQLYQCSYILLWVGLYAGLEFLDHYIVGGISYKNGWSWPTSGIFDVVIFSTIWLHYLRPVWAWIISLAVLAIILFSFDFLLGEFK